MDHWQPVADVQLVEDISWLHAVEQLPATYMQDVVVEHTSLLATCEHEAVQREFTTSHWQRLSVLHSVWLVYAALQRSTQLEPESSHSGCDVQVVALRLVHAETHAPEDEDHMH